MTEKQSHLFNAVVVKQFDSLIHIENSSALKEIDDSFLAAP